MSGAARTVKGGIEKALGKAKEAGVIKEVAPQPAAKSMASEIDEDRAARRRARRGGRALLSEARLNPEQGTGQQTLGSTGIQ